MNKYVPDQWPTSPTFPAPPPPPNGGRQYGGANVGPGNGPGPSAPPGPAAPPPRQEIAHPSAGPYAPNQPTTGGGTQEPYNMQAPGYGEQWWSGSQQDFQGPSAAEQYWNGMAGTQFGQNTNSQDLYSKGPADLSAYYNDAYNTSSKQLNDQLAARGVYNSGVGIDENRMLSSNLAGQQAQAKAQYMQQMAGQSDQENQSLWGLGGRLAAQGDASSLARHLGGMQGAFGAQGLYEGRNRGNLHDMLDATNSYNNTVRDATDKSGTDLKELGASRINIEAQLGAFDSLHWAAQRQGLISLLGLTGRALAEFPKTWEEFKKATNWGGTSTDEDGSNVTYLSTNAPDSQ